MIASAPRSLPYGRQAIDAEDVAAVVDALKSEYLTTGPWVARFEEALCAQTSARYAVAVSNCTAALHLAARAAGLGAETWTVVPANTFLATANAVRLTGGEVQFADVDPETGQMTPETFAAALARRPARAAIPVHFAGPAADMRGIAEIAARRGVTLIEDAAHAIGTLDVAGDAVGACTHSAMTCFSFHPVKTITTGEGGAILTNDAILARTLRRDRSHGITRDPDEFTHPDMGFGEDGAQNPWYYEMQRPGLNYRITDIQCALGLAQLRKLPAFKAARAQIKSAYDRLLADLAPLVSLPPENSGAAWHLYPLRIDFATLGRDRASVMRRLQAAGVSTQVHYIPVHLQPYYRERYGRMSLPGAEKHYRKTLSLPLFPGMTVEDAAFVAETLRQALGLESLNKKG